MAAIRTVGDNTGCMALKGASPAHEGEERPDRWALSEELAAVGERWGIDPSRDLAASWPTLDNHHPDLSTSEFGSPHSRALFAILDGDVLAARG